VRLADGASAYAMLAMPKALYLPAVLRLLRGWGDTRRNGAGGTGKDVKSYFGYKLYRGDDAGSELIRKAVFTPARTQETR